MDELHDILARGAAALALTLPTPTVAALADYARLVEKWARRINLTATRDAPGFAQQHILDALALVPHVPSSARRTIDVGSGAGIPGVVIAAAFPRLQVVALEPVYKKHAFLATARRELGLDNFVPIAQRMEAHIEEPGFTPYDLAMSRATIDLGDWLAAARALVQRGRILGMEGAVQHGLPPGAQRAPYQLPFDPARRRAVIILDVP